MLDVWKQSPHQRSCAWCRMSIVCLHVASEWPLMWWNSEARTHYTNWAHSPNGYWFVHVDRFCASRLRERSAASQKEAVRPSGCESKSVSGWTVCAMPQARKKKGERVDAGLSRAECNGARECPGDTGTTVLEEREKSSYHDRDFWAGVTECNGVSRAVSGVIDALALWKYSAIPKNDHCYKFTSISDQRERTANALTTQNNLTKYSPIFTNIKIPANHANILIAILLINPWCRVPLFILFHFYQSSIY